MKKSFLFSLLIGAFILTGCPSDAPEAPAQYVSDLERLQKNNMDFPDLKRYYFSDVYYDLSDLFSPVRYLDFVLSDDYETKMNSELNVYFSIESFTLSKAETFKFKFDDENLSLMDAVHDHYAIQRNSTLEEATVSIKKAVPKSVGFPGVMQTITGESTNGVPANTYFFATLDMEDQIIVVQLIGKDENMGYLYDDFIDIISSISN